MHIAILNLSGSYKPLDHLGTAAEIIQQWLAPHFPEAKFDRINIVDGEPFPAVDAFDGYIISGSEKGVYDEVAWMEPLKQFLQSLRDQSIPVFGICFGHQIMAEAYGGKAIKADHGFVVGAREYSNADKQYNAFAMHKDQVVEVPEGATVTISAPYCPVAGLQYSFAAKSVQFHPEFETALVSEAIEAFDGELLTADEAKASRDSVALHPVAAALYAQEAADFFRRFAAV
jgi:GMP synthase-like glutamine amidotransferase